MKRLIAVLTAAVMLVAAAFAGTAMAAGEDLEGEWYLETMKQGSMEMDVSLLSSMGLNMVLTLNADGTCTRDTLGIVEEGTWKAEGEGGTLTFDSEEQFTIEDGKLVVVSGDQTNTFGRDGGETIDAELAPAVENPQMEDYEGAWKAVAYVAMGIPIPLETLGANITVTIADEKAAVSEEIKDISNDGEIVDSMEAEFPVELKEDGTLYLDFAGEDILGELGISANGISLTLHEDGRMSGTIPGLGEELGDLSALSDASENADAEEADAVPAEASGNIDEENTEAAPAEDAGDVADENADGSSGLSMDMYLIFEKTE